MDIESIKKRLKDRAKPAPPAEPEGDEAAQPEPQDELEKVFSPEQAKAIRDYCESMESE